jgi:hypothetical protein
MHETANVYPVLRPVGPAGTIEADREDEDLRYGLTPLGAACLALLLARPGSAPRTRRRAKRAPSPPLGADLD